MAHHITPGEAIQQWIDDRLAEAPPITPEQAGKLIDLLAGARNQWLTPRPLLQRRASPSDPGLF